MDSSRPVQYSADAQISAAKISIAGITLLGGSDTATLDVYNEATSDKTAAKKVLTLKAAANTVVSHDVQMYLNEGCYIDVTGTSPVYTVFYK